MPKLSKSLTAPRKRPVQARSTQLVADILEAAIRVLQKHGAARFTTIRVAEAAGVSVGSLYQYFPNKQAILYRLQVDEWERTAGMIDEILGDTSKPARARLHAMTFAFFVSECEEAPLRRALAAAAPSYHDAPESKVHRERSRKIVASFLRQAAPRASGRQRQLAMDLVMTTVTAVGKQVSERQPSAPELQRWATAIADMIWAYLAGLGA